MLTTLSIRDVVLIGRLDLSFHAGLCVLTGETGSGKSILLDALGLALGMRAEARLVRHGADQASVTALFDLAAGHPVLETLNEHGIAGLEDGLMLRRVLGADGRSKAFINDQPVSVQLLKETGGGLVEVHGQFENQRLLNEAAHRGLLDSFGDLSAGLKITGDAHKGWKDAAGARIRAEADMEAAGRDGEFLRHALDEITALDPKPGEETGLARQRTLMMHGEQLVAAMNTAAEELRGDGGALRSLEGALRELKRVAEKAGGRLADTLDALARAQSETAEADALLEAAAVMDLDPRSLEQAEERLFALRALARKHSTEVDGLAEVAEDLAAKVQGLEDGGARLAELTKAEKQARETYESAAAALSQGRGKAAGELDKAVARELKPLKLEKAKFTTALDDLPEDAWGPDGRDKVVFQVTTNPGAPAGPLAKISSGGELARFTLALKAVLAQADPVPILVFDEVDSDVGGAVAAAVGERLAGLAGDAQVLVVTHSPQVAARGMHHWLVSKSDADPGVLTTVDALSDEGRKEEIARMLAGAKITDEARAAADSLLEGAGP
ncbi:MAG: DNA repair protein RecN [Rhodospirillaceae bacterium]|jgi:DNA repair protein RecN (Recombination protein N)|nr:DNA repair protein RecN [Rhodospirillaceae bacterium]